MGGSLRGIFSYVLVLLGTLPSPGGRKMRRYTTVTRRVTKCLALRHAGLVKVSFVNASLPCYYYGLVTCFGARLVSILSAPFTTGSFGCIITLSVLACLAGLLLF
ncbi:hypothetical protein MA16_Dca021833 [Dendrobium catenatum]|uniref:Uncharacterized protein n=1 Tax=Dendrobium catenatum TaxID=906689 RepID=A0A2I0VLX1_9ASPA|nr:hypothetical protein MA16_Dca021833 [Dendrobium catenatum]